MGRQVLLEVACADADGLTSLSAHCHCSKPNGGAPKGPATQVAVCVCVCLCVRVGRPTVYECTSRVCAERRFCAWCCMACWLSYHGIYRATTAIDTRSVYAVVCL